jgi:glycosyltransferase involved in cell wall biosynthesis
MTTWSGRCSMPADALRIAVISAQAYPLLGGVESHVDEVTARLVADGHRITILTTDRRNELPRRDERHGASVRRFRAWPRNRDYYASPGLIVSVLRERYDLLHVQGIHTLVPPFAMVAAIVRRVPFVVTFHTGGSSSEFRTRMRGLQFRVLAPLLRRASALVAVSHFEASRFEQVLNRPAGSITVIRNGGLPLEAATERDADPDLIVSVGRLERYKGHHRAIEALPLVLARRPGARLRILGAGPYEAQLRALAEQHGVADRVTIEFLPPQQRTAMAAALAQAGVVSLLSDYESHPVAVIEALGVGRPVVVLNNSGLTELVEQGWVLGLQPDASPQLIADALIAQLDDPRIVATELLPTWGACVAGLEVVYAELIGRTRGLVTVPAGTTVPPGTTVPAGAAGSAAPKVPT